LAAEIPAMGIGHQAEKSSSTNHITEIYSRTEARDCKYKM
jgi:hypothetical protein